MALIFQDGFSLWGVTAQALTRMITSTKMWTSVASTFAITTANPRISGGYSLYHSNTINGIVGPRFSLGEVRSTTSYAGTAFGVGAAIYITALPVTAVSLLVFKDQSNFINIELDLTPSGALALYRGPASTLLASSPSGIMTPGVYNHVECKVIVPSSNTSTDGECYVRVNNIQVIAVTGADLAHYHTPDLYDTGQFFPSLSSTGMGPIHITDVVVWDDTGSSCNDWIGNKAVYTFMPDADGGTLQWSPTGTTQHFDAVNETTPDGDSTYIAATAAGQVDILEVPTITSTLTGIKAATIHTVSKQDSAGVSELRVSLGGTTYTDGTARIAAYPSYTAVQDHFYTDPDGAGALTPTLLSAMKIKLTRTV